MTNKFETYSFSGESINCYGLEIVRRRLKDLEYTEEPFSLQTENPVLFSLYWPEQIFDFLKFKFIKGMENKRVIVGGNTATANPSILASFGVDIYLGDGETITGLNDKSIVNINTTNPVNPNVSEKIHPVVFEDVQQNRRTFIEISRGCANKCSFCQYAWLKPYRECSPVDIKECVLRSKTKSIRAFSADRFQHHQYDKISELFDKYGKNDTSSDVSIHFLLKNPQYLKCIKKVRTGVEGLSYKLRRLVGKKFTNEKMLEFTKLVVDSGIKCFDWYMIYGLPEESAEDYEEFTELLRSIDEIVPLGYTIAIHWNAFTPSPQTPFQWEAPAFEYKYKREFMKLMSLKLKNLKIMHKPKLSSDETILKRMLCIRAGEKSKSLISFVTKNQTAFSKAGFLEACRREFQNNEGYDLLSKLPTTHLFPWDKYVVYDKEKMITVDKSRRKFLNDLPL